MFRALSCITAMIFLAAPVLAQDDLKKMVDTEFAFAAAAAEKGTPASFVEYMTDDAVGFTPDVTAAKPFWSARKNNGSLLKWAPNYADISANGSMGFTTGNWEWSKTRGDAPSAFGHFITIWLRQPAGGYKWVLDIGIDHGKPEHCSTEWSTSTDHTRDTNSKSSSAADSANGFQEMVGNRRVKKAYESYAAQDIRLYRENIFPIVGKNAAIKQISSEKGNLQLAKKSSFYGSADLAYTVSGYKRIDESGKVIEKGNYMQIWKLTDRKWRIVLEVLKPVPDSGK